MFEQIEKLKQELTDKYVVVAADVPELARFGGYTGQVKTVNMSGRALVEFDAWSNIGWYDIDVDYLRVVPKPEPAAEGKKQEAKPAAAKAAPAKAAAPAAGEKKLSPLEMARMQGGAKGAAAAPAAKATPAAKPAAGAAGGKMSTADILAASRAKKDAGATASAAPEAAVEEAPAPKAAPAKAPAASKPAGQITLTPGQRPSVSEILAFCRQADSK